MRERSAPVPLDERVVADFLQEHLGKVMRVRQWEHSFIRQEGILIRSPVHEIRSPFAIAHKTIYPSYIPGPGEGAVVLNGDEFARAPETFTPVGKAIFYNIVRPASVSYFQYNRNGSIYIETVDPQFDKDEGMLRTRANIDEVRKTLEALRIAA